MLLDHRTYLEAKAEGEISMFGKAKTSETAKRVVRRGPVGMVKAELPEPQCPFCKCHRPDTAEHPKPLWSLYDQRGIRRLSRTREVLVVPARFGDTVTVTDMHSERAGQPIAVVRARTGHLNRPETSTMHEMRDCLQGATPKATETP
jgi:hypothetical protein